MQSPAPQASIAALRAGLAKLPPKDQEFASSLLGQFDRFGRLSERQWPHVAKLAERAEQGEKPRELIAVGDLSGVLALFTKAGEKLQAPAIVLGIPEVGDVRISVAGETARVPGSLNVVTRERDDEGRGTWFGRILLNGDFEASPRVQTPRSLLARLMEFAEHPAEVAAEHGKLTGECCFCGRALADQRSTEVGYGKTCARNWGQPYPTSKRSHRDENSTD
jgi:hypothetical protein